MMRWSMQATTCMHLQAMSLKAVVHQPFTDED